MLFQLFHVLLLEQLTAKEKLLRKDVASPSAGSSFSKVWEPCCQKAFSHFLAKMTPELLIPAAHLFVFSSSAIRTQALIMEIWGVISLASFSFPM